MAKCSLHQGRGRPPKTCIACRKLSEQESPGLAEDIVKPGKVIEARRFSVPPEVAPAPPKPVKAVSVAPSAPQKPSSRAADWPLIPGKLKHKFQAPAHYPEWGWCVAPGCTAPKESAIHDVS